MDRLSEPVRVNGRDYARPHRPVVVVCVDGCEYDYLTEAAQAGVAPFLARLLGVDDEDHGTGGFTDLDGSRPDAWRYVVEIQDAGKPADATGYR